MGKTMHRLGRSLTLVLSAGAVLQVGGCASNPSELIGGLLTSVVNSAIASFVFGSFGLAI